MDNQQENLILFKQICFAIKNKRLGSSETTRKAPLNIKSNIYN